MSRATKTLSVSLFIAIIAALFLNYIGQQPAQHQTDGSIAPLPKISEVDRITVKHGSSGSKAELKRNPENDTWEATQNGEASAVNAEVIEEFTDALAEMDIHREVTSDASRHPDLHVDESGSRISWYQEDNLIGGVVLGRFNINAAGDPEVFFRPSGSDRVYTANPDVKNLVANIIK